MRHSAYRAAEEFDRMLGDPRDEGRLFSHARSLVLDEREEFPLEICRELDLLGLPAHYVPVAHGGAMRGFEDTLQIMRGIARRDLTVAIAHGKTFLGAVSVWVAGDPRQSRDLAAEVLRGTPVSWGLTERDHGSDLLAGEVRAERTGDGYRVTGEKWLINNATRGDLVCVLARTAPEGGPRGFSVLLIDKRRLDPASFRTHPAARLHGIRGADISGVAFTGAEVDRSALIGAEGDGLEIVLKSLQLTRILCAALSLGALDQALDMATGYALARHNHGTPLVRLPQSRRLLAQSYADLLTAEALTVFAARALHTLPGELSLVSAVTKFLVPTLVEQALGRLSRLVGTRSLLLGDTFEHGRFQKVLRDHRIVGIFDGSSVINLNSLVNQFPLIARAHRRGAVDEAGLHAAAGLTDPLPDLAPERLELLPRHGSSLLHAVPAAVAELRALAASGEVPGSLAARAAELAEVVDEVIEQIGRHKPVPVAAPAPSFRLAEDYSRCFAAAAALQLWLRNRSAVDSPATHGLWESGLWLECTLTTLLRRLRPTRTDRLVAGGGEDPEAVVDRLVEPLIAQHSSGQLPSLLPYSRLGAPV
ncbi:acyl-CoA dehydrogenase [Streptomyces coacervatus]|uniref:Acyl-CoA dehydrogenase n=1 Tax=Streptomyces coacervatus TaxID=647381 RepID=A0ABP7I1Y5_9ACTN|nr:acyl-CoA dehydrogenase family protein [Streptomyces coacervatus]MDF2267152.1 acyl-CoA dehydrogenase family protein [Streptomyces coacervatus]